MKKIFFVFPILALLAAGCNSSQPTYNPTPTATPTPAATVSPTPTSATPSPVGFITKQQAIDIANKNLGGDPANYQITASFKNSDWHVDYVPKKPINCTNCQISGGDVHFIIDGKTGAILSKTLGQ